METPVYKYQLNIYGDLLMLPRDSQILTVRVQYGRPVLYMKIGTAPPCGLEIFTCGTGHSPRPGGTYIGTTMLDNETLVIHYFAFWHDPKEPNQ